MDLARVGELGLFSLVFPLETHPKQRVYLDQSYRTELGQLPTRSR